MGPKPRRRSETSTGRRQSVASRKGRPSAWTSIVALEARLEAYSARASTAHTRLMKTIDVLDALHSQHALEISAEEQAKLKLIHQVDRWRRLAMNLEVEKDELKDVVEDLIEKVQVSNEWNSWPCSRMRIAKHAEQVVPGALDCGVVRDAHNDELLAYATSIIARLRTELYFERQSHSRSVEEANLRIEELEAKVAVREAELEMCIISPGGHEQQPHGLQNVTARAFEKRKLDSRILEAKPLSDEECLRFLESNNARNRSLEIEIRQIAEKLEKVRTVTSTSSVIPTPNPRTRSASVDSSVLSRPFDAGKATLSPAPTSPSTMLSIAQLDNPDTDHDLLKRKPLSLMGSISTPFKTSCGSKGNVFGFKPKLTTFENSFSRLVSLHAVERKPFCAKSHNYERLHPGRPFWILLKDWHQIFSPQPLEEDITAEESMELASPLMPTIISDPLTGHPFQDVQIEADLAALPFSPRHVSSPAPAPSPTSSPASRRSSTPQDIERVQAVLDVARTLLAQKEEALEELRAEMERLQLEMQTKSRHDGSESGNGDG
ncbi:hypothetical protein JVU11DRAFT_3939 [Chiua virens]|nr:hypothetical protein JVU11DRAFT_3939 [Chiua virens]